MIIIILAGALGLAGIVMVLLFRHLRALRWQLIQLRVERDRERIMAAILAGRGLKTADGQDMPEPAHRKRHLFLYLGGGALAALGGFARAVREAIRGHPSLAAGGAAAVVATAAAVALLVLSLQAPDTDTGAPGPSMPGIGTPVPSGSPPRRGPSPSVSPPASPTGSPGPTVSPSATSSVTGGGEAPLTGGTEPADNGTEPGSGTSGGDGSSPPDTGGPGGSGSTPPDDGGNDPVGDGGQSTPPDTEPPGRGLCIDVDVPPLLDIHLCL